MVSTSVFGCDTLVLSGNLVGIRHIPLDDFTLAKAEDLYQSTHGVLEQSGRGPNSIYLDDEPSPDKIFQKILSQLRKEAVKPILEGFEVHVSSFPAHSHSF